METNNLAPTMGNVSNSYKTVYVPELLTEKKRIFIPEHPKFIVVGEKSVRSIYQPLIEREISPQNFSPKGNPEPYIEERLWRDENLKNKAIPGFDEGFISTIYRFNVAGLLINNEKIVNEAVKTGAIRIYDYLKAHFIIMEAVKGGEVDSVGEVLSVYFHSGNIIFRLYVCRRTNRKLCIFVTENNPKGEFHPKSGVCF